MANTAPAKQAREQLEILADKDADSTDSDVRYMAYGARLRTVLRAGQRYIAYVRSLFLTWSLRDRLTYRPVILAKHSVPWSPLPSLLPHMAYLGYI